MGELEWTRREGATSIYYTAETPLGRVRVSRVNKHGVAAFRAYFPDGRNITKDTVAYAQLAAEDHIRAAINAAEGR